jgi:H+/Cl- antiporter ClcA
MGVASHVDSMSAIHTCAMTSLQPDQAKGQVDLLVEEYRSLHSNINVRISAQATLLGFLGAGLALSAAARKAPAWVYVMVAALFLVVVAAVWMGNNYWISEAGSRIAQIEKKINDLARSAYNLGEHESLLTWQGERNNSRGLVRRLLSW